MSILIDKVRIKNFRSLKDVAINLEPITLLVGANNAGKTSFLRALNLVLGNKTTITKDDLFIDKNGDISDTTITIDIHIIPVDENGNKIQDFSNNWLKVFGNKIQVDSNNYFSFAFRTQFVFDNEGDNYQKTTFFLDNWESPNPVDGDKLNMSLNAIAMYFIDAQRDLVEDLKLRTSYIGKLASQIEYGEKLAEIEGDITTLNEKSVANSKVLSHLKIELAALNTTTQTKGKGVEITPFPTKIRDLHKNLKVHFQDNTSDTFSLEYHGMGTRSWASILTFNAYTSWEVKKQIVKNEPYFPLLALEEPEAHLHPNAQRTLYKQLKTVSGQKIVSTHSPYIAGQAKLEELRHFYKQGDFAEISQITVRGNLERKDDLNDTEIRQIYLDIQSSKGEILFSNAVVMFEGETEEQALPIFANKYWGQTPFELGINFVKTGKNYHLLRLLKFLKIEWFIFSDYDNSTVQSDLKAILKKVGILQEPNTINNVVLLGNDIEEYLYDNGYENELKSAFKKYKEPIYHSPEHRNIKEPEVLANNNRIDALSKEDFLAEIKDHKSKLATIYSQMIVDNTDASRCIPPKIRDLFNKISAILKLQQQ